MAYSAFRLLVPLVAVVVMVAVMAEATPPGIAKNPSHATCKIKKYKHCYNLVHVCPKFCPDQCTVECASCKPICGGDANPPPEDDPTPATPSPPEDDPTPATPSSPSPPSETYYSPPPPVAVTPTPPTSTPTPSYSPPLPPPTPVTPSPPPPTSLSPPPPPIETPSTPPTISSPPPVTSTPPPVMTPTYPNPPLSPPVNPNPPSTPPTNPNTPSTPPTNSYPPANPNPPSTPPVNPNPPSTPPTNSYPPKNPNTPSTPPTNPSPNPPSTPPTNPNPPSTPPANPNPPSTPPTNSHPPTNPNPPSMPPTNPNPPTPSMPNSPSPSLPPPTPSETPNSPTTNTPPPASPRPSPPASPPRPPPTGVTGQPPAPTPPSSSAGAAKRVRCKNVNYPQCYNMIHTCPSACPGGCQVDCVTCKPVCHCDKPGAVCQDPRFIGGDGITFYFHGKKDRDFCLVSDQNLHINAHFIGKRNPSLKRDFTWVQSLGILFQTHRLFIAAQKTAVWDDSADRLTIALDGRPVTLPESGGSQWQHPSENPTVIVVRLAATNHVMVEVKGLFRITAKVVPITEEDSRIHNYGVTEEDSFAHLDVGFKFFGFSGGVNGILGQTYGAGYVSAVNVKAAMAVMGREEEFETSSLFAADCAVARFGGGHEEVA